MPQIPIRLDLTANQEVDLMNQPNARQFATLPYAARVRFALFADTGDTINAGVFVGGAITQPDSQLPNQAVATPATIENLTGVDVGARGSTISIPTREMGGVAATVHGLVEILPI